MSYLFLIWIIVLALAIWQENKSSARMAKDLHTAWLRSVGFLNVRQDIR
jgi:hypothetical protein